MAKFNVNAINTIEGTGEMQKTRATTLQQRFGFQDSDLATPQHDALMVWLDGAMENVVWVKWGQRWTDVDEVWRYWQHKRGWTTDEVNRLRQQPNLIDLPPVPVPVVQRKIWESPILGSNKFTIGFVDMVVEAKVPYLDLVVKNNRVEWAASTITPRLYFEVKPSIASVGEVIRQIRMYEVYDRDGTYYVVSPDDRFASVLKDQGIGFVKVMSNEYDSKVMLESLGL